MHYFNYFRVKVNESPDGRYLYLFNNLDSNSKFLGGRGRVIIEIFSVSDVLFRLSMIQTVLMDTDSSVAGGRFSNLKEFIGFSPLCFTDSSLRNLLS